LHALERFGAHGLLPEQVWDLPDLAGSRLRRGGPTGSAMPLVWAHAEYLTLARSIADGQVFDVLPLVAERYAVPAQRQCLEFWKLNRHSPGVAAGQTLRVQAPAPFRLRWTGDEWQTARDTEATATQLGIHFVDLPTAPGQQAPLRFTFYWTTDNRWEGRDYEVRVERAR
jgi:glucoamylase